MDIQLWLDSGKIFLYKQAWDIKCHNNLLTFKRDNSNEVKVFGLTALVQGYVGQIRIK